MELGNGQVTEKKRKKEKKKVKLRKVLLVVSVVGFIGYLGQWVRIRKWREHKDIKGRPKTKRKK